MSIVVEGFLEWLRDAGPGFSYGFIQAPLSIPKYERTIALAKLAASAWRWHQCLYVVPDHLSMSLMSRVDRALPIDTITTAEFLYNATALIEHQSKEASNMLIVVEADLSSSVEFCWTLFRFMLSTRNPTAPPRCRIAVVVASHAALNEELEYLSDVLACISRGKQEWATFDIPGDESAQGCTLAVEETNEVIIRATEAVSGLKAGETVVVCGAADDIPAIKSMAADKGVCFVSPDIPDRFIECASPQRGTVIYVSGTSSIAGPIPGLKHIFVFTERPNCVYLNGHFVQERQNVARPQMDDLVHGHAYQATGVSAGQITAVVTTDREDLPPDAVVRYINNQILAFVWYFFAARISNPVSEELLEILVCSDSRFFEAARRLLYIGCLQQRPVGAMFNAYADFEDERIAALPRLLLCLDQDMESAWFLSSCVGTGSMSRASAEVKLAMVRLAVLKKNGTVLSNLLRFTVEPHYQSQRNLMEKIIRSTTGCSFPRGVASSGWLWFTVMTWVHMEKAVRESQNPPASFPMSGVTEVGERSGLLANNSEFLRSLRAVEDLDDILCPEAPTEIQLRIDKQEFEQIMTEVAVCWMYSCIFVRLWDDGRVRVNDLINFREVDMEAHDPLDMSIITPDGATKLFLAVPLHFELRENAQPVAWDIMSVPHESRKQWKLRFSDYDLEEVFQTTCAVNVPRGAGAR